MKSSEEKLKEIESVVKEYLVYSNNLYPEDVYEDELGDDGEEIFDKGRGQGMFEVCNKIRGILEETK